jgi:hypothetical protein
LVHGVLPPRRKPAPTERSAELVHGVLPPRHKSGPTGWQFELVHGPLTPSVKRETALGWFLALLEMLAHFMEGAQAMSRAVRWGDAA